MSTEAQIDANRRNAIHHGLTTGGDFIPAEERDEFLAFTARYLADLNPEGIAEESCVLEVRSAAWRLRRCRALEASLPLTAAGTDEHEAALKSIERARAHAHNTTRKAMVELRRLRTERELRREIPAPIEDTPKPLAAVEPNPNSFCKTPQPIDSVKPAVRQIPRGSLCPCQSGRKFKRCCGRDAPPVHHHGAKKAA